MRSGISVVMLSLNEAHNMERVCKNLAGWATNVYLVDSYSKDDTVSIALKHGVTVVQRKFKDFGDQWNFAINELPINTHWTMKLDPDEQLTDDLKRQINAIMELDDETCGIEMVRRLWFMRRPLPQSHRILRVWRTGACHFTDVAVNEHPIVNGKIVRINGEIEHHDSPNLHHWIEKQNRYSTAEAVIAFKNLSLAATPSILGTSLQRRMWLKKHFHRIPFRFTILFFCLYVVNGLWRAGWVGYTWSRLRVDVLRLLEMKKREMQLLGHVPVACEFGAGEPDSRVQQY
ncbi:MAG: glycosyltransferase family 2 protein [Planctomycetales bacterium]|nr:glycosyltransferase family 2 protein [Planctomycetales bacterium]